MFPKTVTHVAFDLDRTLHLLEKPHHDMELAQIEPRITELVWRELLKNNPRVTLEEADAIREQFRRRYNSAYIGIAEHLGVAMEEIVAYVYDQMALDYSKIRPIPGVREALMALREKNYRLCVISDATISHVASALRRLELADQFGMVFCLDHHGFIPKANPERFHRVLWEMDVKPENMALFDDSRTVIGTAREVGFAFTGYIGPARVVASLRARNLGNALRRVLSKLPK